MRIVLIINPAAGQEWKRSGIEPAQVITDYFSHQGNDIDVWATQAKGDAINLARKAVEEKYEMVIAAGGDGTVNEVVNGLVFSPVIFALIPLGTENVLAKEMGIPFNINKACEFIREAPVKRVDVGKVKDRYFLSFAGVGLDAHAVSEVPQKQKEQLGSLAFFITGLRMAWKYRKSAPRARVILDGREEKVVFWLIIVGNISTYGWKVKVTPEASINDGLLDICIFPKTTYFGVIRQVVGAFVGVHLKLPEIRYYKAKTIEIKTKPKVLYEADGELMGWTPCLIEAVPDSLSVKL
jgi:YegS/Rv2252/BmrU family lipid kinase